MKLRKKAPKPKFESTKYDEPKRPKRKISPLRVILFLIIPIVAILMVASYNYAKLQSSEFEAYYNSFTDPASEFIYVNVDNPLDPDYVPADLVDIELPTYGKEEGEVLQLNAEAYEQLEKMFADAEEDGIHLMVGSAYRSFDYQWQTYYNWVDQLGASEAAKVSAKPGSSEHQTGLAVDLFSEDADPNCFLETCFEDSEAFTWLVENSYKYGFILRYPKDKTEETGFSYEPWHYRYVGVELATYLYENNLTLDEYYLELTKLHSSQDFPTFALPTKNNNLPGM